ncbi:MAG: DASS family sodium-coupled anion symporter [Parachlamydiales bacterium]
MSTSPQAGILAPSLRLPPLLLCFSLGALLWFLPAPVGVSLEGWHLLALFLATIAGIILKPLPMGAVAFTGLTLTLLTGTLPLKESLASFGNPVVWLVFSAFIIARGFFTSGLATRMAYSLISLLGKRTLGLGMGLILADLSLAPAIPSDTARSGGIVMPILRGLVEGSKAPPKMAAFLTLCAFQGSVITSSLFLTAMASNLFIAELARGLGYTLSWTTWTLAALVPAIVSLLAIPALLYRLVPPGTGAASDARNVAKEKLKELGPLSRKEGITLSILLLLLTLWIGGATFGVAPAVAAMTGITLLLITGVLNWDEITGEKRAWETLIWYATLIMMATHLQTLGVTDWIGGMITRQLGGVSWQVAFPCLALLYFFAHYLFAGNTSHISAFFVPFATIAIGLGTPPMLALLTLAYFSCLFAGITHYGTAAAPLLFGTGYVDIKTWWRVGLLCGLVNILVWGGLGSLWWHWLGLW